MTEIVEKGTPGAISLKEALKIQKRRMGITYYDENMRKERSEIMKNAWSRGDFSGSNEKRAKSMKNYWGKRYRGGSPRD